jgi:hypothetical protein
MCTAALLMTAKKIENNQMPINNTMILFIFMFLWYSAIKRSTDTCYNMGKPLQTIFHSEGKEASH